ncbi:CRISPR-associated protein Cas1 [Natronocella acetinitrilica]|uniref:CRISPR-associated endonuclease Cas1 n=1 Tax=Natronocella acetinitrilica TaxID=414046 RepID=A0AAE3G4K3_9GAMM|nr:type I-F CRISPR-associated endonuclease Cas1f [Natronocella acetinitrilica]MCP1674636.1 CRISPR-associated protein Cas1 [Natronocella acetinitrilica]
MLMPSQRQGVMYLEHCRIVANDHRISFVRKEDAYEKYWSIPHYNVACLLLGSGTSLTQQAARQLAEQGVMFAFVGGGGTPLYLASQSEYRPTEHLRDWLPIYQDPERSLRAAVSLQTARLAFVKPAWKAALGSSTAYPDQAAQAFLEAMLHCKKTPELLGHEANYAKALYRALAEAHDMEGFRRDPQAGDVVNALLDHGNYLAYGLAAVTLWALGIPPALAVVHGKTRRGGLVFDLADVIKDGVIMPIAFASAAEGDNRSAFRRRCVDQIDATRALPRLFKAMKDARDAA